MEDGEQGNGYSSGMGSPMRQRPLDRLMERGRSASVGGMEGEGVTQPPQSTTKAPTKAVSGDDKIAKPKSRALQHIVAAESRGRSSSVGDALDGRGGQQVSWPRARPSQLAEREKRARSASIGEGGQPAAVREPPTQQECDPPHSGEADASSFPVSAVKDEVWLRVEEGDTVATLQAKLIEQTQRAEQWMADHWQHSSIVLSDVRRENERIVACVQQVETALSAKEKEAQHWKLAYEELRALQRVHVPKLTTTAVSLNRRSRSASVVGGGGGVGAAGGSSNSAPHIGASPPSGAIIDGAGGGGTTMLLEGDVLKAKPGTDGKKWQLRRLVLFLGGTLSYFKGKHLKGSIDLEGAVVSMTPHPLQGHAFTISYPLYPDARAFLLATDCAVRSQLWVEHIKACAIVVTQKCAEASAVAERGAGGGADEVPLSPIVSAKAAAVVGETVTLSRVSRDRGRGTK